MFKSDPSRRLVLGLALGLCAPHALANTPKIRQPFFSSITPPNAVNPDEKEQILETLIIDGYPYLAFASLLRCNGDDAAAYATRIKVDPKLATEYAQASLDFEAEIQGMMNEGAMTFAARELSVAIGHLKALNNLAHRLAPLKPDDYPYLGKKPDFDRAYMTAFLVEAALDVLGRYNISNADTLSSATQKLSAAAYKNDPSSALISEEEFRRRTGPAFTRLASALVANQSLIRDGLTMGLNHFQLAGAIVQNDRVIDAFEAAQQNSLTAILPLGTNPPASAPALPTSP